MNILYATPEAYPFVKTGGLADVSGSLPAALATKGADCRVILPLYDCIKAHYKEQMTFHLYSFVYVGWRRQYCGLFSLEKDGATYYFVDNEYYFRRGTVYGSHDDAERFAFFSSAVVGLLPELNWTPDVISCNDWQTALIPVYLRLSDRNYSHIRTVFTIHNIEYQGRFGANILGDVLGLPEWLYSNGVMRYDNDINLMKGAIYFSDYLTTVSPTYAQELRDPYHGCGLDRVIEENSHKLCGILNGIDTDFYNPAADRHIYKNYSRAKPADKAENKRCLQSELGLEVNDNIPIIACVSRLVSHKGMDLISFALEEMLYMGAQFVLLGTGDLGFESRFRQAADWNPGRISANIMYSDALASKIYAGADMLLMPSKSEPCGLSQMIAMRYGTLPLVREVGGLKDTVIPYPAEGCNGFTFAPYYAHDMIFVLRNALNLFHEDKKVWKWLIDRAMSEEFGWERSAGEYIHLYGNL